MKQIYLLFLLSILSLNLFCQVHWTKHPDNPVSAPGAAGEWDESNNSLSSVIYYDSAYHMWYSGGEWVDTVRIGYATSPDGITWAKDPNNPVMDVGPVGAWDDHAVYFGDVLVIDSIFHMWYTGHTGQINNRNYQIGHATSPDGINWTMDPNNPVLSPGPEGTWEEWWSGFCKVVDIDGTIHMWYTGWNGTGGTKIGYATSPDGVTWTKDPNNPVITAGPDGSWDPNYLYAGQVIFDGSTFQMWFDGDAPGQWIGYATSEDGQQWVKYDTPVLRNGSTGSWDAGDVYGATVLFDSTDYKYKMWYTGKSSTGTRSIGYAESDTCSDIIRPVLVAEDTLYQPGLIDVTSSKDGIIYLVPNGMYYSLEAIREATIDSVAAIANTPVQISLVGQPNGYIRLFARDNRNNISDVHRITILGVGTLESRVKSPISIYPNPAASIVNIQTNKSGEFSIVIETLNGKEISSDRFNGNTHQLDLSSFQKGVYLITIRSKDFVTTRKIIKL